LSVAEEYLASGDVSGPTGRSVGSFFVSRVVGATALGRSVVCKTFQSFKIRFELNEFLVEREC